MDSCIMSVRCSLSVASHGCTLCYWSHCPATVFFVCPCLFPASSVEFLNAYGILADWLIVWSDDISPRDVIGRSATDGGKRQRNDYIDRPDTVTVVTSPDRQNREPVYEPTGDQAVYEETDIDARHYEGLGPREPTAGQQPVYQPLAKGKKSAARR